MPANRSRDEAAFGSRSGRRMGPAVVVFGDDEELTSTVVRTLKAKYEVATARLDTQLPGDAPGVTIIVTKRLATVNPSVIERLRPPAGGGLVIVTTESRDNFRALARLPRFPEVVVEEDGGGTLLAAVVRCELQLPRAWIIRELESRQDLPGVIRTLVRRALDEADWSRGVTTPVSTITTAASLVGCSRSYLQKLASERNINLRGVLDAIRLYSAMEMRAATRAPWETIARRLGYASGSGLTGLAQRCMSQPLTELQRTSLYDAARAVVLQVLSDKASRPPIHLPSALSEVKDTS